MKLRRSMVAVLGFGLASLSCEGGRTPGRTYAIHTGGDASEGARVIVAKGCGSCHTNPGIRQAQGVVGPPLLFFSRRTMIAGEMPNTPENLLRWIRAPQLIEPNTAMPNLSVSEQQARDVAAYLYTLR